VARDAKNAVHRTKNTREEDKTRMNSSTEDEHNANIILSCMHYTTIVFIRIQCIYTPLYVEVHV